MRGALRGRCAAPKVTTYVSTEKASVLASWQVLGHISGRGALNSDDLSLANRLPSARFPNPDICARLPTPQPGLPEALGRIAASAAAASAALRAHDRNIPLPPAPRRRKRSPAVARARQGRAARAQRTATHRRLLAALAAPLAAACPRLQPVDGDFLRTTPPGRLSAQATRERGA